MVISVLLYLSLPVLVTDEFQGAQQCHQKDETESGLLFTGVFPIKFKLCAIATYTDMIMCIMLLVAPSVFGGHNGVLSALAKTQVVCVFLAMLFK